ncbi:hypothetical protein GALMADRAFT_474893 [Galerina marginata CBS 339.88]|uniref:Uncharacterized protein n=1 Tax=Galerina marginata (strain CBS 339.88) TaxID=685588 RepID=A0A067SZD6_GALM3|nr:hypothetical protein GALMADRAFT_474893 [Galerina marginata CBS 339.88]
MTCPFSGSYLQTAAVLLCLFSFCLFCLLSSTLNLSRWDYLWFAVLPFFVSVVSYLNSRSCLYTHASEPLTTLLCNFVVQLAVFQSGFFLNYAVLAHNFTFPPIVYRFCAFGFTVDLYVLFPVIFYSYGFCHR